MKHFFLLAIILITGILILNNSESNSKNLQENNNVIVPMAEGNYWTYLRYYYNSSKKNSIIEIDTIQFLFGEKVKLNNEVWYQWGLKDCGFNFIGRNKEDGFWNITHDKKTNFSIDSAYLFFKYPTYIGDVWYNKNHSDSMQTLSVDEDVIVPAGKYKCIHYLIEGKNNSKKDVYFTPGVGMIKYEFIGSICVVEKNNSKSIPDTTWNLLKLKSYNIK
jgi:hypothetical protein